MPRCRQAPPESCWPFFCCRFRHHLKMLTRIAKAWPRSNPPTKGSVITQTPRNQSQCPLPWVPAFDGFILPLQWLRTSRSPHRGTAQHLPPSSLPRGPARPGRCVGPREEGAQKRACLGLVIITFAFLPSPFLFVLTVGCGRLRHASSRAFVGCSVSM